MTNSTSVPAVEEDDSVWQYSPSFALSVLAMSIYAIIFIWLFFTTVFKYRAWFFTTVVVGAAVEAVGYALRSYSAKEQNNLASPSPIS
jgi:hypothetical protein